MESTNSREMGYTDEQWESLLCRTFDEPTPAPKVPEPPKSEPESKTPAVSATPESSAPKPETTIPVAPVLSKPVSKKKRNILIALFFLLAVSLVLTIVAFHIFPIDDSGTAFTEEQQQCMEALRQWQEAQNYNLSISTTILSPYFYKSGYVPITESVYFHGDKSEFNWSYVRHTSFSSGNQFNSFTGQAKIDGTQYTYSGGSLQANLWKTTEEALEISKPWILSFSLNDVQILDQHVLKKAGGITAISFAVVDLDPDDAFYGQGPYRLEFYFTEEGQLNEVRHCLTNTLTSFMDASLTITTYYHTEWSAEFVENCIKSQINNPTAYPGLFFDSSSIPDVSITVED